MNKLLLLPFLLTFACLLGGFYGALHNQISYTVSASYFHDFKFRQFGINPEHHNRIGAALVGIQASWWMGLVIGLPIYLVQLPTKGTKRFVKLYLQSALTVVLLTLCVGLLGLFLSTYLVAPQTLLEVTPNRPSSDPLAFARAGTMHDFSYLGGLIGLIAGAWISRRRSKR